MDIFDNTQITPINIESSEYIGFLTQIPKKVIIYLREK